MIAFVAYHIDFPRATGREIQEMQPAVASPEPRRFITTMLASAARTHRELRQVVLTDQRTPFDLPPEIEIFRCDLDTTQPMLSRSVAWLEFLDRGAAGAHVVFLDSDILVNANIEDVFARDFDVGLTYRNQGIWPINAGVIFNHGRRLDRGRAFHSQCLAVFRERYLAAANWGGDQDALREMVSAADFARRDVYVHQQHGFDILMLPCAEYNFTAETDRPMTGPYPDRRILHFRGRRKDQMLDYFAQHGQPPA